MFHILLEFNRGKYSKIFERDFALEIIPGVSSEPAQRDGILRDVIVNFSPEIENMLSVNENNLKKIKEFTITKTKENEDGEENGIAVFIDNISFQIFKSSTILEAEQANDQEEEGETMDYNRAVALLFWSVAPRIVFFDDFCDLLPDKISISNLSHKEEAANGYRAVLNLESILGTNFVDKDNESDPVRRVNESKENERISIDFQGDWGQKIYGENKVIIKYNFEKREGDNGSYVNFYVETKDGQPLPPRQRSKGLIWFLSLWLELKAEYNRNRNLIILLDEPDQHLHIKAQKDILNIIDTLSKMSHDGAKSSQVFYATHSPHLIQPEYLNRIKLVLNDENEGTKVEGITTSRIDSKNKQDAFQPIAIAIGSSVIDTPLLNQKKCYS